jgi:hypothetical protein
MPNILTIHRTGSVGKTTLASLVVRPRLGGKFFSFEKVDNIDGTRYGEQVIRYTCENYHRYQQEMYLSIGIENTLTDVGGNEAAPFLDKLEQDGGVELYDYVLVPTDLTDKAQENTISTVTALFNAGLEPERLRIVLNKVRPPSPHDTIEMQYEVLFAEARKDPRIRLDPKCYMQSLGVFASLAQDGLSWAEVASDKTDYMAELIKASAAGRSDEERLPIVRNLLLSQQVMRAGPVFDIVYKSLKIGGPYNVETPMMQANSAE